MGEEVSVLVTAVKVCPNTVLPLTVTVPLKLALVTVMVKVFVKGKLGPAPFTMVAKIVAVPELVVLRVLDPEGMLAPVVPAFDTLHVMVLLVASLGTTVLVRVSGKNAVAVVGTPVMSVTGTWLEPPTVTVPRYVTLSRPVTQTVIGPVETAGFNVTFATPLATFCVPKITTSLLALIYDIATKASFTLQLTVNELAPEEMVELWVTVIACGVFVLIIRVGSPKTIHELKSDRPPLP